MANAGVEDKPVSIWPRRSPFRRRLTWNRAFPHGVRAVIVILASFFWLFPIYWIIVTSLKSETDIGAIPPVWIFQPVLDHWKTVLYEWNMLQFLKNSLLIATVSTVLTVLLGTMAAYSLSRFRMRGKQIIALDILSIRMVPPIVTAVPIFLLARMVGLYNTYALVILLYVLFNLPFVIWVMKGFLDDIPIEIEEAARVDGCGVFEAFFRIILPIATPGLACVSILTFILCWNEFLFSSILLAGDHRTVPVVAALGLKPRAILWGSASAAAFGIIVPVVILTFFVQRWIVRGLSLGAVKE
jgi:multiple sugar transport system permease protein